MNARIRCACGLVLFILSAWQLPLRAAPPQFAPPEVTGFTPQSGAQGSTVRLTVNGFNFRLPVNVILTPSAGLTISNITLVSPTQLQATVTIDPAAQLGIRQVQFIIADRALSSRATFTITPAPPPPPPPTPGGGQPGPAPAALRGYSPTQGTQGTTVTLTFTGANFAAPASVQFAPPAGLLVQNVQVTSANQLQVQLQITTAASVGPHNVTLVMADRGLPAQLAFTVNAAPQPVPVLPSLTVLRVTPNQIAAGSQNVDLKIEGTNFAPGAQVSFATESGAISNVFPLGVARFVNSTEIHVLVNVLPAAIPGGRDVSVTNPTRVSGTAKGLINVTALALQPIRANAPPPVVKLTPIAFPKFTEGKINLQSPQWGTVYVGEQTENDGIPPLNDQTVFKWTEQNPGLADYFELRIYARDAKTVIAKKQITGKVVLVNGSPTNNVPTYFRVDPAFLAQTLSSIPSPKLRLLFGSGGSAGQGQSNQGQTSTQPSNPPKVSDGDLQWEVAGFRTYNKNGSVKLAGLQLSQANASSIVRGGNAPAASGNTPAADQADVEVEISDHWPLSAPQAPNGLDSCPSNLPSGNGLNVTDVGDPSVVDKSGKIIPGKIAVNDYVGDPFVLSGDFDLSRSPYATQPKFVDSPCPKSGCPLIQNVQEFQFDNVFVDWGDGHVSPLGAPPASNQVTNWSSNVQLSLPGCVPGPQCSYSLSHTFDYPGVFNVRVFQLSDADTQQVNPSLVASSVDGPAIHPYMAVATISQLGGNAASLTSNTGAAKAAFTTFGQHAVQQGNSNAPSPGDVAKRGYMIYCNQIIVTNVEDLVADGPLHLKSVDAPDFGSHDINQGRAVRLNAAAGARNLSPPAPATQRTMEPRAAAGEQPSTGSLLVAALPKPTAVCSECDDSLIAQTQLHYYGHGQARIVWHLDNGTSKEDVEDIGPSTQRPNLTRQNAGTPTDDSVKPPFTLYSDRLPLAMTPRPDHAVWVEATVLPGPPPSNLSGALVGSLHKIVSLGPPSTGKEANPAESPAAEARSALSTLAPPPNSGLPPLKVGFLSPSNHGSAGMAPVQYVNDPLSKIAGASGTNLSTLTVRLPDGYVKSNTSVYEVTVNDPKQPCKFEFPVKDGGSFEVTGLQNHVTESNGVWNGTGTLLINLAATNGYAEYPGVAIDIKGWKVGADGTVQSGSFDASPALKLAGETPALTGTIDRVQGTAGQSVTATLSVQLTDKTVRLPGSEVAQKWPGVTSTLTPAGDWYAENLQLPLSLLGWSSSTIQSSSVRLDLSHAYGDAPAASFCAGGSGTDWVGVRLVNATIIPYTMDLLGTSSITQNVTTWGFDGSGVCGQFNTGSFTAKLDQGTVHFDSIIGTAQNGTFTASYNGMDVKVPWLDADLHGNAQLQSGGGQQASISFPLQYSVSPKTYTNVVLKPSNLQFTKLQNVGWAVYADTEWDFSAEEKSFAKVPAKMYFSMDGRAYFEKASTTQDVQLGGTSSLGDTPLELISAHLSTSPTGTDALDAMFQTKLHLSEVMPASDVQVNYSIQDSSGTYSSLGPTNTPFTVEVPYPAGQPASDARVHPVYNSSNSGSQYSGTVDLSELGGPPITGEFRLGYQGGHDYWITRVTYSLGQAGVTIIPAPPIMNLFAVRGGLGHNFPLNAFTDAGSLQSASPVMDNSFLFLAGMRVGMPDQFTYTLDGNLTIKASGPDAGARMDFKAWLLTHDTSGNGNFQGFFQYAGNNFDGRLWGHLDMLNGAASFDLGNSENNAAIAMHFGNGPWYIDAGKKEGPRITAHLLVADAGAYVMLGSDIGLALGGSEHIDLEVGDDSVASAFVRADMEIGIQITPQPHFIGDFDASAGAGVCVDDVCVSDNVSAQVHVEALPIDIRATASLPLPWPLSNITFTVHL
jgi:hypothetical protein